MQTPDDFYISPEVEFYLNLFDDLTVPELPDDVRAFCVFNFSCEDDYCEEFYSKN